jgi:predicted AAA+ superfamily ATPase
MKRSIDYFLSNWRKRSERKPLILRGARQVGKTHAVTELGKQFDNMVQINFEKMKAARPIFDIDLDPKRILRDLSLFTQQEIIPGKTLLFLDEAQEQSQAIIALRYFYEEIPELHVVAAGSLLNFAIDTVGVPVGRTEFLYMYPVSFIEFLCATGNRLLAKAILDQPVTTPFAESIHDKIIYLLGEYFATGGMPKAVKSWCETQDINAVMREQSSIVNGYIQDIPKYARKSQIEHVNAIFKHIPLILGQRFKTQHIAGEYRKRELSPAIDLLEKAMIIHKIYHTSSQGLPLAAQSDLGKYKLMLLDIAIAQKLLNSDPREWILNPKTACINKGALIEAFVGQEIVAYQDPSNPSELFYWHREERSSCAEVDYVMAPSRDIIPVEVKSDKGSSLKSMRILLESHPNSKFGVRFSNHNYSVIDSLHSYPLYAVAALFPENRAALEAL